MVIKTSCRGCKNHLRDYFIECSCLGQHCGRCTKHILSYTLRHMERMHFVGERAKASEQLQVEWQSVVRSL